MAFTRQDVIAIIVGILLIALSAWGIVAINHHQANLKAAKQNSAASSNLLDFLNQQQATGAQQSVTYTLTPQGTVAQFPNATYGSATYPNGTVSAVQGANGSLAHLQSAYASDDGSNPMARLAPGDLRQPDQRGYFENPYTDSTMVMNQGQVYPGSYLSYGAFNQQQPAV